MMHASRLFIYLLFSISRGPSRRSRAHTLLRIPNGFDSIRFFRFDRPFPFVCAHHIVSVLMVIVKRATTPTECVYIALIRSDYAA